MVSNEEIFLIVNVYLIGAVLQLVSWPYLRKIFSSSVDFGWGFGRVLSWLMISLLSWWLSFASLTTRTSAWAAALFVLITGGLILIRERKVLRKEFLRLRWVILVEEILFLMGFLGICFVRSFNPDIFDLEKFMDAGFMASYLRAESLPTTDMWLAGEKINYYTFGHFMGATLIRIWGIDLAYSYNLLLGWLMGLVIIGSFSVVINLIKKEGVIGKREMVGGLVGSLLVGVGGNSHMIWYFLKNRSFESYWYADATRFIENTIHEFPSYSFVVSDLHAHLWGLPIALMFVLLVTTWSREMISNKKDWLSILLGAVLGVMAMTNTWDVLIYGLLLGLVGLLLIMRGVRIEKLLGSVSKILVSFIAVSFCFAINFESIGEGVRLVTKRSPAWQLLALWGGHLVVTLTAMTTTLWRIGKKRLREPELVILAIGFAAIMLLLIPELVYVKDIYPNHPRANTMFKLTYQAFVLMGLLGGWLVAELRLKNRFINRLLLLSIFLISSGLMIFPYFGYRGYYGEFKTQKGLDGLAWMARDYPDDYMAINWLKENVKGRPVILEAVGESYTTFGRVSTFTGLPTVLGWRVHEWLWRGGFEIPGARTEEVRSIYEEPKSEKARNLLMGYQVKYVFVGTKEAEIYKINLEELLGLGKTVYSSGETKIIELVR